MNTFNINIYFIMKNFKSIIAIFTISAATVFSSYASNENPPIKKTENLRAEIVSILGTQTPFDIAHTSKAEVLFTVNDHNEIVVLSVNSDSSELNSYVKSKLNYKKLSTKDLKSRALYTLPVTLKTL